MLSTEIKQAILKLDNRADIDEVWALTRQADGRLRAVATVAFHKGQRVTVKLDGQTWNARVIKPNRQTVSITLLDDDGNDKIPRYKLPNSTGSWRVCPSLLTAAA